MIFFGQHGWENTFMIGMCLKFYKARLTRTIILVEICQGKEPGLAGCKSKLWQLKTAGKSWWIFLTTW